MRGHSARAGRDRAYSVLPRPRGKSNSPWLSFSATGSARGHSTQHSTLPLSNCRSRTSAEFLDHVLMSQAQQTRSTSGPRHESKCAVRARSGLQCRPIALDENMRQRAAHGVGDACLGLGYAAARRGSSAAAISFALCACCSASHAGVRAASARDCVAIREAVRRAQTWRACPPKMHVIHEGAGCIAEVVPPRSLPRASRAVRSSGI